MYFVAGWGSSLKLLETQKQLQAKKCVLQNVKVCELCITDDLDMY